ncbi:MAG: amino acid ABC transporter permease [Clostridia bacterium]|nr:amino acid ABC transporter permease [Clostridia bacterium]
MSFKQEFITNFIKDDRWKYLVDGLWVTLIITFGAAIIGVLIGFIVAAIRTSYEKTGKLKVLNAICKFYLTVTRGTPMLVQLLIIYFVILAPLRLNSVVVAVVAFGINSGAYVAEIVRSGIMSIDSGQFEASRSLGMTYGQTMIHIILPQAFKNILPALLNEIIALLKETSIAGYIAIQDLTKGGYIILGRTFSAFMPLIAVALIYLILVLLLTKLTGLIERRLRASDR